MNRGEGGMYLLVHTVTITEENLVVQAQFFHTFIEEFPRNIKLIGRRMRYRPRRGTNFTLKPLEKPTLKGVLKRKSARIKHHLRTIHLGHRIVARKEGEKVAHQVKGGGTPPPPLPPNPIKKIDDSNGQTNDQLTSHSSPEQTSSWLTRNRFDRYIETFSSFSGADMLRMSREDLIQICGQADGIRLFNAVHLKTVAPKLKIYVCRENTSIFNAVFLLTHSNSELLQRLSSLMGVSQDQVHDIYMEGPHSIQVQLTDDVIRHIKEETMFSVKILQENGSYAFFLKRTIK